jgi:dTDP-4-amino-4,6-dideoxy-D-galactose acyltransferase
MKEMLAGKERKGLARLWGLKRGGFNRILPLKWDSDFFGFPIGRIQAQGVTAKALGAELERAKAGRIEFVELFCDAADSASVRAAEETGFRLADLKCHLTKPLEERIPPGRAVLRGWSFEKILIKDLGRLASVEAGMFRESRYYQYPGFDEAKVDLMFKLWLENAVKARHDDECFVISRQGEIGAFCTIRSRGRARASIGLFGVRGAFQGRGLAGVLLGRVSSLLRRRGVRELDVATQAKNRKALCVYQRNGFVLNRISLAYYKPLG